ncbi:MAG: DUF721 domain-containing protein [Myxococcales bacterium]|jgi:hypothetical protein
MPRRKGSMQGISSLVSKVYPSGPPEEVQAMRLLGGWGKVVSRRVLENARPVRFRHGVLTVHTATSAWANALSLESEQLLARLRGRVPGVKLKRIAFRAGPLPEMPEQYVEPTRPDVIPLRQLPEEIARALARVSDDGLRSALHRAASVTLARERAERDLAEGKPRR